MIGTLHVREADRSRTIAVPLTVEIVPVEASASTIPGEVAFPSEDRVSATPDRSKTRYVQDEVLVYFKANTPTETKVQVARSVGGVFIGSNPQTGLHQLMLPVAGFNALTSIIATLSSFQAIDMAIHHVFHRLLAFPNDPGTDLSYAPNLINLPAAWDLTPGSREIRVGVIDTVFDFEHADLIPNVHVSHPDNSTALSIAHGTRVASIVGAAANNWNGIAGVMWNADLHLYSASDSSKPEYISPLLLDKYMDAVISDGIRVVNLSLGLECTAPIELECSQMLLNSDKFYRAKISHANKSGADIIWVIAAGNGGVPLLYSSPARLSIGLDNVLSVSAVDHDSKLARFSDYGAGITVAAPGVNIVSLVPGGGFNSGRIIGIGPLDLLNEATGTSFAAPFVTGTAGLMLSMNPRLTGQEIKTIIRDTAHTTGNRDPEGNDVRVLDVNAALLRARAMLNKAPVSGFVMSSGSASAVDGQTLTVLASTLGVATVTFDASNRSFDPDGSIARWNWTLNGASVGTGPRGTTPSITESLPIGKHTVQLTVVDNLGRSSGTSQGNVEVRQQVNQAPLAAFTLSASGQSANEGGWLNIAVPLNGSTTVFFDGSRSHDSDGVISKYEWTSNGSRIPSPTFEGRSFSFSLGKGTHAIALVVTDNAGARSVAAASTLVVTEGPGQYRLISLGTLPGRPFCFPTDLNDNGDVVGSCSSGGSDERAFIWTMSGGMKEIAPLPGPDSRTMAFSINNAGQVVGRSGAKPFLYAGSGTIDLGVPQGITGIAAARVITNSGQIVVVSGDRTNSTMFEFVAGRVFLWEAGKYTELFTPYPSDVTDFLDTGRFVGNQYLDATFGYVWSGSAALQLPVLPNVVPPFSTRAYTTVRRMNSVGQAVGSSGIRAFIWSQASGINNLGVLQQAAYSSANGINSKSVVVGTEAQAFIWTAGTGMQYLTPRISNNVNSWWLWGAADINEHGQITGYGAYTNGAGLTVQEPYLLTPMF